MESTTASAPGCFVFSLDTELAWGYFDNDSFRRAHFSHDGSRERDAIARMLDILDEFAIAATWAVVGHMFYRECEACEACPVMEWKGRFGSFDEVFATSNPLWYGADVVASLVARSDRHEIGFHGYTHRVFDEATMTEEEAQLELREWLRVAGRLGIVPHTVVFPRNRVGHLRLFAKHGFLCYRGAEALADSPVRFLLGKAHRWLRQRSFLVTPPVYDRPQVGPSGLVNLPGSPNYFRRNAPFSHLLDSVGLGRLNMSGALRGVSRAAKERKVVHLWSHPCDFVTEREWDKLRYLFANVAEQVSAGRLRSVTMGDVAREAHAAAT